MTMAAKDWATGRATVSPPSQIPVFASVEEEAAFWDTHSFTKFADELQDITDQISFRILSADEAISLQFDRETIARLNDRAKIENTDPTTLVRRWVLERLRAS